LSGLDVKVERKWGKPCYTMDRRNVVIIQGFKEYCALGFFQGALPKDPKKLLVQHRGNQHLRRPRWSFAADEPALHRRSCGCAAAGRAHGPKQVLPYLV
jgi:hypothetical protein